MAFDNASLVNLQEFIKHNVQHITCVGIFGALMWYFAVSEATTSFGNFLPLLTICLFLFFIITLIFVINNLSNNKKGDYIFSFEILISAFAIILSYYTINLFTDIIASIIKLFIFFFFLFSAIKIYDKHISSKLENNVENNVLAFIGSLIIILIFYTTNKLGLINKDSIIYPILIVLIFLIFLLLLLFPFFFLVSKLYRKIESSNKAKWIIIISLVILIVLFISLKLLDIFDILRFIAPLKDALISTPTTSPT